MDNVQSPLARTLSDGASGELAALHQPPRYPRTGLLLLAVSQVAVVAVWWAFGWRIGLPAMLLTHLPVVWATLTPNAGLLSPVLRQLPLTDQRVWLTIDDGPSDDTRAVLNALDRHDASATFFLIAEHAAAWPDLVREIVRRGHTIGNHSATHPASWFWALGPGRIEREIAQGQAVIERITGEAPRWFRAVVGMANPFVALSLHRHGLARVGWTTRGFDGIQGEPGHVVDRLERRLRPGAIVLLHEGAAHGNSVAVIDAALTRLGALGYRTVLPEQLAANGS